MGFLLTNFCEINWSADQKHSTRQFKRDVTNQPYNWFIVCLTLLIIDCVVNLGKNDSKQQPTTWIS